MAGKRFAILIASSRYPDEPGLTPLRCPENDVDALNEVLRSPDFGQFTKTVVLKNAPSHEVLEQIETVLHDAGREDLVLIYFSGHGKLNPSGQLCLATANTKLRALGSTSIPVERIKSFFDAADTRQKILILDCCYSGAAGAEFVKGGVDDQLQLMSGGQGTFIMTASTGIQVAVEKEGDSLGLFTKHLVDGIHSGAADRDEDGLVDIHELYDHVYEKVRAEGAQEPMKWDIHAKGRMIIAKSGKVAKEPPLVAEVPASSGQKEKVVIWPWLALAIALCVGAGWYFISFSWQTTPPKKNTSIGQYIDHGDGTVTDTKTGLMWKRCLEGLSGVNCENGKKEEYKWDDAVKRFKNVAYAGYSDWRLPTIDELKTLLYCSKGENEVGDCNDEAEKPTINQQAFPNTEIFNVWSESPYTVHSGLGLVWSVNFDDGYSGFGIRSFSGAVQLVRGGQ